MSLQAYQRAAEQAEGPKQTEYRLFGLVTRALMDAAQKDVSEVSGRMKALHWNRRLWTTLAADCANPENRLPMQLRANIISLSIWVDKHTSQVMQSQAAIQPLIDVNRIIMQGLSGQMASGGQAAADGPAPLAQSA
ncbi:MAG TPA: flagellar biosynthesis regulator FlaF [Caulobacteraceae bacterium]|jgi:flagellar protein FlaF